MQEGDLMSLFGWENSAQIHKTYGASMRAMRARPAGHRNPVGGFLR